MSRYYFVGIKGSGMSALAQILFDRGYEVLGSDVDKYFFTETGLIEKGIQVLPFNQENINGDDIYIIGNAFNDTNAEVNKIYREGYENYTYGEFLSMFLNEFVSIAVSGTHGKTTTTSMLTHILQKDIGVNSLIGDGTGIGNLKSNLFAFEACEYKGVFLNYEPDIAIINNIDFDHPDHFTSIDDVFEVFQRFALQTKKTLIVNGDDPYAANIRSNKKIITFGLNQDNRVRARNIKYGSKGTTFDLMIDGKKSAEMVVPLYGEHNVYNALSVVSAALVLGLDSKALNEYFASYTGAKRRFDIENVNGYDIVDDYAHHPEEIEKTIQAAKQKFPDKEVVAVFQPHTYSRLFALSDKFNVSLSQAENVYICDVFASEREKSQKKGDFDSIFPSYQKLRLENITELMQHKNSVLLFMGAGDIGKYIQEFKKVI